MGGYKFDTFLTAGGYLTNPAAYEIRNPSLAGRSTEHLLSNVRSGVSLQGEI